MPRPLPRFRPGDALTARTMNDIVDRVNRQRLDTGQSVGIDVQETPNGTIARVRPTNRILWGVADGDISARSGATLGTGKMTIYQNVGGSATSTGQDIDVINPSATTMTGGAGIASGKYCFAAQDADGYWVVAPLEC